MSRRVIDLTLPLFEGMLTYPKPWHPPVSIQLMGRHCVENRETRRVTLGTHTGTHCDAPRHMIHDGATTEFLDLDILIGPAKILDMTDIAPGSRVGADELEKRLAGSAPGRLLLNFGWSQHYGTLEYYSAHPGLDIEAARYLSRLGVRLLGMDTPSPDHPGDSRDSGNDSPVHHLLLGQGLILVEYLCNLDAINAPSFELCCLPLNLRGADGAPSRCVAIVYE